MTFSVLIVSFALVIYFILQIIMIVFNAKYSPEEVA